MAAIQFDVDVAVGSVVAAIQATRQEPPVEAKFQDQVHRGVPGGGVRQWTKHLYLITIITHVPQLERGTPPTNRGYRSIPSHECVFEFAYPFQSFVNYDQYNKGEGLIFPTQKHIISKRDNAKLSM